MENDNRPVNLLLADELNRVPGKTLAALLQPAQEKAATIGDITRALEELYMIAATINPVEQEGTFTIPEAMIDRFAVLLLMGYVTRAQELEMLRTILKNKRQHVNLVQRVISKEDLLEMREHVNDIAAQMSNPAMEYIVDLVRATRPVDENFNLVHDRDSEHLSKVIQYGASPRAEIWTAYIAAAKAVYDGEEKVTTDHIKAVAGHVLRHRIILQPTATRKMKVDEDILARVFERVKIIDGNLPD